MKRMIFILVMVFVAFSCANAQVKVYTDQLIADSITFNRTDWVNEWSKDGTFGGNSDRAVPTEKAVVTYLAAQLAAITASTDTTEVIRLIGAYMDTVNISFDMDYDAVGDTLTTYYNGDWGYTFSFKTAHQDSLNMHTDSLQSHNTRIKYNRTKVNTLTDTTLAHNTRLKAMELIGHTHANTVPLALVEAGFTNADSTRLKKINDTILVMVRVTDDTLETVVDSSGWILPINRTLNGCTLIQVEAFSPGEGTGGTAYIGVIRKRSGSVENVTSTAADIGGTAVINTAYDDVATNDYYNFTFRETGASPNTIAADVYLKFLRP
jgi:hypothetical protein